MFLPPFLSQNPSGAGLIGSYLDVQEGTAVGSSDLGCRRGRADPDPSIFMLVNYAISGLHVFISNMGTISKYFSKSP